MIKDRGADLRECRSLHIGLGLGLECKSLHIGLGLGSGSGLESRSLHIGDDDVFEVFHRRIVTL